MFTEKERLLANEAKLISSLLSSGLDALRRAELLRAGLFYQAFFSLSIGIERMLKIIIIHKYRVEHKGEFPTSENMKKYGHNLRKLFAEVGKDDFDDSIQTDIIDFLNDFAKFSRYYNIDVMTNQNIKDKDPLVRWKFICDRILDKHGRIKPSERKIFMANLIDRNSDVFFYNLDGNSITSYTNLVIETENNDLLQGYSVWYIFEIIKTLNKVIVSLEYEMNLMPVLSEFFGYYSDYWKPYQIRKKKNWINIYRG